MSTTAAARVGTFEEPEAPTISRVRALWIAMKRKPLGAVSAAMLVVLVLTAVFADVLAPYDPLAPQPEIRLGAPTPSAPTTSVETSSAVSSTAPASRCGWGCWRSASGPSSA